MIFLWIPTQTKVMHHIWQRVKVTGKALSKQVYTQIREDLQSLLQSDKTAGVFIGECLGFYLLQLLSSSYHVQHSLEFLPLIIVS